MSDWRRVFVPGGTYGFTLVTERRAPIFTDAMGRTILRETLRDCRRQWPFVIVAIVLLPDHLHTLWRLPDGDSAYPRRLGWVKKEFTKSWLAGGGAEQPVSAARQRHRRRGVLQRKFWEHCIRDDRDLHRHLDYLHYNPVKHGYVPCARDWPWSSFHRYVRAGVYTEDWGCAELDFSDLADGFGEPG
jgi:putative transposase